MGSAVQFLFLVFAGALAAAVNAVAGGGSLLSFPALIALGVPPLAANATNSLALWPGSLASALGFANHWASIRHLFLWMLLPSALGAALGAWLLVNTSERLFSLIVPILLLVASILLAFQPRLRNAIAVRKIHIPLAAALFLQFFVSVYGGYFGAGMGILMLAIFGFVSRGSIHELNALKTPIGVVINLVASIVFIGKGVIVFGPCVALMIGAVAGGYLSAKYSQRIDANRLRKAIFIYGIGMTIWFGFQTLRN